MLFQFRQIYYSGVVFSNNGQYPTYASPHALLSYNEKIAFMGVVDTHCVVCVLINQHSTIFAIIRLLFDHDLLTTCQLFAHQLPAILPLLAHYLFTIYCPNAETKIYV